ncbi:hypothetical protein Tco_1483405 [Tanacetum coccineum]
MDPNTSTGRLCLGENNQGSVAEGIENKEQWEGPEFQDTASSGQEKETKYFTFYIMEEKGESYFTPCYVGRLHAYDGEINLKYKKNLISNEFAVKLCLEYEEKSGENLVKRELLVSLKGEFYFVKFIVNPEEEDVEPNVILDNSEDTKNFKDDWDHLLDIDFGYIPEINEAGPPPFVCKMGKSKRNKKRAIKNFQLYYSDVGPSLSNGKPLTQKEAAREALAIDICKRFSILEEERPVIETMAYSDKYKKILDRIVIDKIKLDGEIKKKEEEAIKQVKGEALQEKEDPRAFIISIRLDAKINLNALADTSSDINVMPYLIYAKLGREEVKKVNRGITMLNHSKAEPIGVLKDVMCQVGVTTIIAKFLILYMPINRDAPILVAKTSLNTKKSESDDEEDYGIQRNSFGAPMYGPKPAKYLNCNDPMDRALALQEVINPFRKLYVWKKTVGFLGSFPSIRTHTDEAGSSSSCPKRARITKNVEEAFMGRVLHEFLLWGNYNMTLKNRICYGKRRSIFDEAVADDELMTKKSIKFRLCGKAYAISVLDFAKRLGLYTSAKIQEYGFETYFIGGLRNDDAFSVDQYWLNISSEETLTLSRSSAKTIRKPVLRVLQKMITYGLLDEGSWNTKRKFDLLWTICDENCEKTWLIPEEIALSIPRAVTPRAQRPTTSYLYDKISQLETRIVTLCDPYDPPSYFEQQQQQDDDE